MFITIDLEVKPDQMTKNGNIYPRDVLEEAITKFNQRSRSKGGVKHGYVNKNELHYKGQPTHKVISIEMAGENIKAHLEILDTREGKRLQEAIRNGNVSYVPIIEVPLDQPVETPRGKKITEIKTIRGIGILNDSDT